MTYFPSNNGRVVELYKMERMGTFFHVYLNNGLVAVATKPLAFEWLRALVSPEFHRDIDRLHKEC